jgi:tRNA-guanine family transglycosylase
MFIIEDALAGRLCTIHNIQYFIDLMNTIRAHIEEGTFVEFANSFISDPRTYFLGGEKVDAKYPEAFL